MNLATCETTHGRCVICGRPANRGGLICGRIVCNARVSLWPREHVIRLRMSRTLEAWRRDKEGIKYMHWKEKKS